MNIEIKQSGQSLPSVDARVNSQQLLSSSIRSRSPALMRNQGLGTLRATQQPLSRDRFNILVVVSDMSKGHLIRMSIEQDDYQVRLAYDGISAFSEIHRHTPDLIILDWEMTGLPVIDFCEYLRLNSYRTPVIILTGGDQVGDRVAGLNAGADDCLAQPFYIEELQARIRVHFRRTRRTHDPLLKYGDLVLDRVAREVQRSNYPIELTAREFDFLEYLMDHPNQVMTRSQILEHVWRNDYDGSSNIIEVYIRSLRQKLEQFNPSRLIQTVRGVGYVLRSQ